MTRGFIAIPKVMPKIVRSRRDSIDSTDSGFCDEDESQRPLQLMLMSSLIAELEDSLIPIPNVKPRSMKMGFPATHLPIPSVQARVPSVQRPVSPVQAPIPSMKMMSPPMKMAYPSTQIPIPLVKASSPAPLMKSPTPSMKSPTPLAAVSPIPIPLVQPRSQRKPLDQLNPTEKVEREIRLQVKAKTSMCHDFVTKKDCKYGNNCRFAHHKRELRPMKIHPKYQTRVCRNFLTTYGCPYGSKCQFLHDVSYYSST